tara:strand:+ start:13367 stop:15355 length:1989 start_codon:yes stop_codon:yes gene_type:complete
MNIESLLLPDDAQIAKFDRKSVTDAWLKFVAGENPALHHVRDEIVESWRRSAAAGLAAKTHHPPHIGDANALEVLLKKNEALIGATKNTWELLSANLLESESLVAVTDAAGRILHVHGNPELVRAATSKNVAPGFDWSERAAGTNAIGTALVLEHPTITRTAEHYLASAKIWDCAAAPVRDLTDGEILGILDIASVGELSPSHALGFAITAAKQIEHALHSIALGRTITLLSWYRGIESRFHNSPALLLDQKGRVIVANKRVYEALGSAPEKFAISGNTPLVPDGCNYAIGETIRNEWVSDEARAAETSGWTGGIVVLSISTTAARANANATVVAARTTPAEFAHVITADPAFMDCIDVAARMAQSNAPVLLTGESGSGKELFAAAIHASSFVAQGAFVAVNCGTLSKELAVTELLGYEAGAFTGASPRGHAGKFEQADGGTIFLDEVGELSADVQVHLLRVLQDNVVVRVGGNNERQTHVRVIAATNRDLETEAEAGRFRMDLYYRLKVLNLELPPLRERVSDVELLASRFIRRLHENYGLGLKTLSRQLLRAMQSYHWPGNVRELHGVLERMYILSGNPTLTLQDLPDDIGRLVPNVLDPQAVGNAEVKLDDLEANAIRSALAKSNVTLAQIAAQLGISRTTLYRRMKAYGIERPDHRLR